MNDLIRKIGYLACGLAIAMLGVSATSAEDPPAPDWAGKNILLILADDIGFDDLSLGGDTTAPYTPTLDRLADEGMQFNNAWSNPFCSPTRATLMTGRYGYRTRVGSNVNFAYIDDLGIQGISGPVHLSPGEVTIPQVLDMLQLSGGVSYSHAAVGKWHLSNCYNGNKEHPADSGFQYYAGAMGNVSGPNAGNYYNWTKTVSVPGEPVQVEQMQDVYLTTETVNDALAWINQTPSTEPWFVYLSFHAAHSPFHVPEYALIHNRPTDEYGEDRPERQRCKKAWGKAERRECYLAMIEAMDTAIGDLLDEIDEEETTIIFVGDNGTPPDVNTTGLPVKGTLYQGGIHVPMIVKSPAVETPGTSYALAHTVDMLATVQQLASGLSASAPVLEVDSVSVVPALLDPSVDVRPYAYSERFDPGPTTGVHDGQAIRNDEYKLIRFEHADACESDPPCLEFYHLRSAAGEGENLLDGNMTPLQSQNFYTLNTQLESILAEAATLCPVEADCEACCWDEQAGECFEECEEDAVEESINTGVRSCTRQNGELFACPSPPPFPAEKVHFARTECRPNGQELCGYGARLECRTPDPE